MTTKLVLRLLDDTDRLLGWAEVAGEARGDGAIWTPGPVPIPIEADGAPAVVSIHWADINVEVRVPCARPLMTVGDTLVCPTEAQPVIRVGAPPHHLAPVTVRQRVSLGLTPATLGAMVAV